MPPAFDPVRDAVRNSPVTPSADVASYNPYESHSTTSSPTTPVMLSPSLGRRSTHISALLNDDSPPNNQQQSATSLSRLLHPSQGPTRPQSGMNAHESIDLTFDDSEAPTPVATSPTPAQSRQTASHSRQNPVPPPTKTSRTPYNPRKRLTAPGSVLKPMTPEEMQMYKSYVGVGAARLRKRKREPSLEVEELDDRPSKRPKDVQAVISHYNARPDVGVAQRQNSPIYGLKSFNNWVKSVLITRFAHPALKQGIRSGYYSGKVLDMGCGKGGDFTKWGKARIRELVAVDIAGVSVEQAQARWNQGRRNSREATFGVLDCYVDSLAKAIPTAVLSMPFDVVSMQFCMHYAFETETKARCMLDNVSRWLRPGGVFLGTIPNAEQLVNNLNALPEDAEETSFGNTVYKIRFENQRIGKGAYGHKYWFYLTDAVDDVPEYLVFWDNFVQLASEYGLEPVYHAEFHQVFSQHQDEQEFKQLLERMKVVDADGTSSMDEDQWDAANIYVAFAFEKRSR
ncbi:mRNA capping enzyme-domain-containing protein [Pterulicium gracile]|uniref:mRNA cap guanine-N(7) methyltransferase n=1 Tax=Pterulicium gracile TaxID=1884261 RepID=A0A5C3QXI7_9AGAR|nr:mRNA capping enzyme-domain-containing protein [Pterula gracilis]